MLYNLKIYYYEKVHFCFFILSLFVYSCTDEPRNELSEKYGFSDEVLESREFNEYVTVFGEGLKLNTVARDNFIKKVEELNKEELVTIQKELTEIKSKGLKKDLNVVNENLEKVIGVSPIDVSLDQVIAEKRELFFDKFPEFKGNKEKLAIIKSYIDNEILYKNSNTDLN